MLPFLSSTSSGTIVQGHSLRHQTSNNQVASSRRPRPEPASTPGRWWQNVVQAETNKRHPIFFATHYAGRFAWFLMDLKSNMANFFCTVGHFFFGRKKFPNSRKEFLVVNSEIFFCQTKKCPTVLKKFAMLGFRSTKSHPNRPA